VTLQVVYFYLKVYVTQFSKLIFFHYIATYVYFHAHHYIKPDRHETYLIK